MVNPRHNMNVVYSLQYYLVWCPKFRRKVLLGTVETDLRELLAQKAAQLGVAIEALEIMPDQVRLLISAPSSQAPHHLANQFKGYTSRKLREKYPELRSRLPSLWSRSYYVGSVGEISEKAITTYMETQKRSPK